MRPAVLLRSHLLHRARSPFQLQRTFCAAAPPGQKPPNPNPPELECPSSSSQSQPPDRPLLAQPQLVYPPSPSAHHSDLRSFELYLSQNNLDVSKTVHVGTHYEYTTISSLSRLGFYLHRVGGRSDCGIDLLGIWSLPPLSDFPPIRVIVQCKVRQKPGPQHIRELEGAFIGAPAGWRGKGVVGLLMTDRVATKGIRDALGRSKWPMVFVTCSKQGRITQFLWNARAEEEGGLGSGGLGVVMRHEDGKGEDGKEVVLTWKGKRIEFQEKEGKGAGQR